jgi:hypothetical protein
MSELNPKNRTQNKNASCTIEQEVFLVDIIKTGKAYVHGKYCTSFTQFEFIAKFLAVEASKLIYMSRMKSGC